MKFKVWLDDEETMGWVEYNIYDTEEEAEKVCESLNYDRSYSYVEKI